MAISASGTVQELAALEFALSDLQLAEEVREHSPSVKNRELLREYLDLRKQLFFADGLSSSTTEALRKKNAAARTVLQQAESRLHLVSDIAETVRQQFNSESELPSDAKITEEIMSVFSSQLKVERAMVSEIAACLPVRITKNRFYDIVTDRLSVYRGGPLRSFDEKTGALYELFRFENNSPDTDESPVAQVSSLLSSLQGVKAEECSEESSRELSEKVSKIKEALKSEIAFQDLLESVLNALLVISLSSEGDFRQEMFPASDSLSELLNACSQMYSASTDEDFEAARENAYRLSAELEGRPENALDAFNREYAEESRRAAKGHRSAEAEKKLSMMRVMERLLSGSAYASYADIAGSESAESLNLSESVRLEKTEALLQEMSGHLNASSRLYVRHFMRAVFRLLPPVFTTQEEVETYILNALQDCRDAAEKRAAYRRISEMIEKIS